MKCLNPDCNSEIPLENIRYPIGSNPRPKPAQDEYPFQVARCSTCKKLHQVTNMVNNTYTERIIEEESQR